MEIVEISKQFIKHYPFFGGCLFLVGYYIKYRINVQSQNREILDFKHLIDSKMMGFMQQVNEALKTEHGFRDDVSSKQHDRIETLEDRIYNITYDINKADKECKKAVDARIKRIEKTNSEYINIMKQELFLLKESIELLKRPKG